MWRTKRGHRHGKADGVNVDSHAVSMRAELGSVYDICFGLSSQPHSPQAQVLIGAGFIVFNYLAIKGLPKGGAMF